MGLVRFHQRKWQVKKDFLKEGGFIVANLDLSRKKSLIKAAFWEDLNDAGLLNALKNEIHRLGIEANPSRTELQDGYDNNNMPSPNWYLNHFRCNWEELMCKIGLEYDGLKSIGKSSSIRNIGSKHALRWGKMTSDELMDLVIKELRSKGLYTISEYNQGRDRKNTPSIPIIIKYLGGWKDVKSEYVRRYGGKV